MCLLYAQLFVFVTNEIFEPDGILAILGCVYGITQSNGHLLMNTTPSFRRSSMNWFNNGLQNQPRSLFNKFRVQLFLPIHRWDIAIIALY